MAVELGAGYVSLTVEARNIARDITSQIIGPVERAMARLGTDAGRKFSAEFADETRRGLGGINLGSNLDEQFGRLGTDAGNDFARQFNQETRTLGDNTSNHFGSGFTSKLGALGRAAGLSLAAGIVGAVGAVAIAKGAVDLASGLNEAMSKVNVVFGDSAAEIVDWSETSATALGQSQLQALEAAGTFGNLFRAMGITTDAATDMSKRTIELASDLASFNNANPEDVLIALKAGLVGETEPLRAFGVNLNDARIKAEAFRLGLVEAQVDQLAFSRAQETAEKASRKTAEALTKYGEGSVQYNDAVRDSEQATAKLSEILDGKIPDSLTAAQKAQAAYSLILGDTSLAQGDFERTSDGLANQQRILSAEFDNLKAKIGTALLPVALRLVVALRTTVLPALDRFAVVFQKDILPALQTATAWIQTNVVPVFVRIGQVLRDDVAPALARFGAFVGDVIVPALASFAAWLGPRLQPALAAIRNGFDQLQPKVAELGRILQNEVIPALQGLWERFERDILPILKQVADRFVTELLPILIRVGAFINGTFISALFGLVRGFGVLILILINAWDQFKFGIAFVRSFVDYSLLKLGQFFDFMTKWGDRVATIATGLWDPIRDGFRDVLNTIIGWWNALEFKLPGINLAGRKYGGNTIGTPDIEPLATGGVITRPTLALLGETSRATPEIVAPQAMMAETFRDELRRFSPMSNMSPVRIEHFHSTEPSRTVLEEMQWRIATGVL